MHLVCQPSVCLITDRSAQRDAFPRPAGATRRVQRQWPASRYSSVGTALQALIHERLFERPKTSGKLVADAGARSRPGPHEDQSAFRLCPQQPWGEDGPPDVAYLYPRDRKANSQSVTSPASSAWLAGRWLCRIPHARREERHEPGLLLGTPPALLLRTRANWTCADRRRGARTHCRALPHRGGVCGRNPMRVAPSVSRVASPS
jgi:hypothetical protein